MYVNIRISAEPGIKPGTLRPARRDLTNYSNQACLGFQEMDLYPDERRVIESHFMNITETE